ncbi:MAG: transposase [Armatimonadota bacterium]|nr:transposase [Armatimonadota bacterium]MDR7412499.1 transposase [Armatimonadota bacterium]MDR7425989.1 transposase [Armatimonadota bacterium]
MRYRPNEYRAYPGLVAQACERYGLRVVAYVLMPDHVHLLLRVRDVPLGRAMQFVQGRSAHWSYGLA